MIGLSRSAVIPALCLMSGGLCSAASMSREYCAFEVVVKSPSGRQVRGAPVNAQKDGTDFAKTMTDDNGTARICDAPSGLVDIVIGGNVCGAVAVRHLRAYWMTTRQVFVTYQNCSGEEWAVPSGCRLTIRLRDGLDLSPIAGVRLVVPKGGLRGLPGSETSDRFGRIFQLVPYDKALTGTLEKRGYISASVSEPCTSGKSFVLERTIDLKRR